MKLLLTLLIVAETASALFAQNPAKSPNNPGTLPPGPLFKPFPDMVRWTITRKASAPAAGTPAGSQFDLQIIGEKSGDVSHVVISYSNGNKKEIWKKGGQQTTMSTGWKQPIAGLAPSDDSEDLAWVSAANFAVIQKVAGRDCLIFRETILPQAYRMRPDLLRKSSVPLNDEEKTEYERTNKILGSQDAGPDPESLKMDARAYIDLESRLPIMLQMGKETTVYKYDPLPQTYTINLPPEIITAIAARSQEIQASERKPVRP